MRYGLKRHPKIAFRVDGFVYRAHPTLPNLSQYFEASRKTAARMRLWQTGRRANDRLETGIGGSGAFQKGHNLTANRRIGDTSDKGSSLPICQRKARGQKFLDR